MPTKKKRKYFGTDGVRGHVGIPPLVPDFVTRLGYAAGVILSRTTSHPTFVIGRDTRQSGEMLQSALTTGLLSSGATVVDFYSGSGTTLIACENLSRRCRAVEIAPGYVAVALERWHVHTGKTPVLLNE